jgi:hypothetical protein
MLLDSLEMPVLLLPCRRPVDWSSSPIQLSILHRTLHCWGLLAVCGPGPRPTTRLYIVCGCQGGRTEPRRHVGVPSPRQGAAAGRLARARAPSLAQASYVDILSGCLR